jgi:hypothetical protein
MWMGGVVPLGYQVKDRKLVVQEREAETVRLIYSRYAELGSVRLLAAELDRKGIRGKPLTRGGAQVSQGSVLARGALYRILSNRLYLGEVHHQGSYYRGEHETIIDREHWDRVARLLAENRQDQKHGVTAEAPSLLAGLLRDAAGQPLTASHASKGNRRYRYYVSRSLLTATREDAPDGLRLPSSDIEAVVEGRIVDLLSRPGELHPVISTHVADAAQLSHLNAKAEKLARSWRNLETARRRGFLLGALATVIVRRESVDLEIAPHGLIESLACWPNTRRPEAPNCKASEKAASISLSVPAELKRSGIGKRMVIAGAMNAEPDPALVKLIVKGMEIRDAVLQGRGATLEAIATSRKITSSYATRLLRLSFLSPELVKMIVDGRQPPTLTARRLLADTRLPIAWEDQLAALS